MTALVLLGAGDHAREVAQVAAECIAAGAVRYELAGYLVPPEYGVSGTVIDGLPILGDLSWLDGRAGTVETICAVGSTPLRLRFSTACRRYGVRSATLVHPTSLVGPTVVLGEGVVVHAGCIATQRIHIGDHTHVNVGCTVSHGGVLGDHVMLSPGVHLGGNVTIESGCFVGIGVSVIPRRRIGRWSTIGAGCTVIEDVPPDATVVGVPGRTIKIRTAGWHEAPVEDC
jgi:sugar O-acyltransferase (sialic acid O-acetyltransferase NeuD family)